MKYRLVTLVVAFIMGCSFIPKPVEVESINLSQQDLSLSVGDIEHISFRPFPVKSSISDIEIEVDTPVVSVESTKGVISITGIAPGKGLITLSTKGVYSSISVEVLPQGDSYLQTNRSSLFLDPGEVSQISSSLVNGTISPNEYVWVSHNDRVAQIVGLGPSVSIVAHTPGETIVECIIPALGLQTTIAIVVGGYSLDFSYSQLRVGEEQTVQILGEGRGVHGFLWRVDDESVATVTGVGSSALLVGLASGVTRFYAEHRELGITLEGVIRVVGSDPAIYFSPAGYIVYQGDSLPLYVLVDGLSKHEIAELQWESNSDHLSILGAGSEVLIDAVSQGKSLVSVTHPSLGLSATAEVVVKKREYSITISQTSMDLEVSEMADLRVSTSGDPSTVQWFVEDPSIVSISSTGSSAVLLGKQPGVTTVKVSLDDGSSASCQVSVTYPLSLTVDVPNQQLQPEETQTLIATHNQPEGNVTWRLSDSSLGTLNRSDGDRVVFTSKKEGSCKVVATLTYKGKQVSAEAEVVSLYKNVSMSITVAVPSGLPISWDTQERRLEMKKYGYVDISVVPVPEDIDLGTVLWEGNLDGFGTLDISQNGKHGVLTKSVSSRKKITKTVTIRVPKYGISYSFTVINDPGFFTEG